MAGVEHYTLLTVRTIPQCPDLPALWEYDHPVI